MRAEAADERFGNQIVQVHLGDAVDRVDQRNRISAALRAARAAYTTSVMFGVS